jgi:hypothetical protein
MGGREEPARGIHARLSACRMDHRRGGGRIHGFVLLILAGHGFAQIGPLPISARTLWPSFRVLAVVVGLLLLVSPRARSFARAWIGDLCAFMLVAALAAFLLSLGPEIRSGGRLISEVGPYHFFYWYVPGFDGLRVPARFAMLVCCSLGDGGAMRRSNAVFVAEV